MRFLRFSIAVFALVCLAGWFLLRQPYSPTQELQAVSYTAFNVVVPDSIAGFSLAQAARGWEGVTASTFNPASGLLVVSHTAKITERDLLGHLQILSSKPVSKKNFPEPVGAKCPVPQAALANLPNWLLGTGIIMGLSFVLLSIAQKKSHTLKLSA